jgi:hypothetical protein
MENSIRMYVILTWNPRAILLEFRIPGDFHISVERLVQLRNLRKWERRKAGNLGNRGPIVTH